MSAATLSSGANIALSSDGLLQVTDSQISAGVDAQGKVGTHATLNIKGQDQRWKNSNLSGGTVIAKAQNSLIQDKTSRVMGMNDAQLQSRRLVLDGSLSSGSDLRIDANTLHTGADSQLAAQRNLTLQLVDTATLRGKTYAGQGLALSANSLFNQGELSAGRDISLETAEKNSQQKTNNSENRTTDATRSVITSGNNLTLDAGRDIHSQAAALVSDNDISLKAGRDVNLNAQQSSTYSESHGDRKQQINESIRQQGTDIVSGGDTTIQAGHDINLQATQAQASGDIALKAGHDINVTTATESDYSFFEETTVKKKRLLGSAR
ncbi:hemagglutinin repeat-containing protein [Yersinia hibernica]|nr:hemagglutinin repeat-containing protein [Yersinia hibernica]